VAKVKYRTLTVKITDPEILSELVYLPKNEVDGYVMRALKVGIPVLEETELRNRGVPSRFPGDWVHHPTNVTIGEYKRRSR
jgi:hypothetical protein